PGEVGVVGDPELLVPNHRLRPDHVGTGAELPEHFRLGAGLHLDLGVPLRRERVAVEIVLLLFLVDHLAGKLGARAQLHLDQPGDGVGARLQHWRWSTRAAGEAEEEQRAGGYGRDQEPLPEPWPRAGHDVRHLAKHSLHPGQTRRTGPYFAERARGYSGSSSSSSGGPSPGSSSTSRGFPPVSATSSSAAIISGRSPRSQAATVFPSSVRPRPKK